MRSLTLAKACNVAPLGSLSSHFEGGGSSLDGQTGSGYPGERETAASERWQSPISRENARRLCASVALQLYHGNTTNTNRTGRTWPLRGENCSECADLQLETCARLSFVTQAMNCLPLGKILCYLTLLWRLWEGGSCAPPQRDQHQSSTLQLQRFGFASAGEAFCMSIAVRRTLGRLLMGHWTCLARCRTYLRGPQTGWLSPEGLH